MTITEFLLARIAEDEMRLTVPDWYCTNSARGDGWGSRGNCPICDAYMFDGNEVVTREAMLDHLDSVHQRVRALAACKAKRRIVEYLTVAISEGDSTDVISAYEDAVLALAAVYADRPDFNPAWRLGPA